MVWSGVFMPIMLCSASEINDNIITTQGSFCECTQPMKDDVTMYRPLSLTGRIHKIIPANDGHNTANPSQKFRRNSNN